MDNQISDNLFVSQGEININDFFTISNNLAIKYGCGANCTFNGIVRKDNDIDGLFFTIYNPIFIKWFQGWQARANKIGCNLVLAHSIDLVAVGKTSYICSIFSKHRKESLEIFPKFIEDFKKKAPIWKFEIKDGKKTYASKNAYQLPFSGLLSNKENKKLDTIKVGILVTSDRAVNNIYEDKSGVAIKEVLNEFILNEIEFTYKIVQDSLDEIKQSLIDMSKDNDLIVTTGGTGPALRDVTVEATEMVSEKIMQGFGELMRQVSLKYVPTAILSRQTAGILNKSLIVNLPGKPKSIRECLEAVFPAIPYCIDLIGGSYIEANAQNINAFRPKK